MALIYINLSSHKHGLNIRKLLIKARIFQLLTWFRLWRHPFMIDRKVFVSFVWEFYSYVQYYFRLNRNISNKRRPRFCIVSPRFLLNISRGKCWYFPLLYCTRLLMLDVRNNFIISYGNGAVGFCLCVVAIVLLKLTLKYDWEHFDVYYFIHLNLLGNICVANSCLVGISAVLLC